MKLGSYFKYSLRFLFLQSILTIITIWYFNSYLLSDNFCNYCLDNDFLIQINNNLLEDRNRFFVLLPERFVRINYFLAGFIFLFLVILYSTKFYTYVNELSFSLDRNYIDEFISIYLLWTSTFIIFLTMFRVSNLISRGYLFFFTFIVPIILLLFRNSEFISSLLGRSITNENSLIFNLEEDSVFRNLRILTFRNTVNEFQKIDLRDSDKIIKLIDSENKIRNINLIVFNFQDSSNLDSKLENYLINLNKKVLIITKNEIVFNNYF